MVVIFSLGTYKTDICLLKQLSVYTLECAVYKISWGGWARGILSTLKIKQKGFCPKKGFCPSWKICRRDSVHPVKMNRRDYSHVAKNMGGIMSTYTKMSGRDYVQEGFCLSLINSSFCQVVFITNSNYGVIVFTDCRRVPPFR